MKKAFFSGREEWYSFLNSDTDNIFFIIDINGIIIDVNDQASYFLKTNREHIIDKKYTDFEIKFPDILDIPVIMTMLETHESLNFEGIFQLKDETKIHVESDFTKIELDKKQYILVNVKNMESKKKAEEELISTRRYMKMFLDSMTNIMVVIDEDGLIKIGNKRMYSFFNSESEIFINKSLLNFFPELKEYFDEILTAIKNGKMYRIKKFKKNKLGEVFIFSLDITSFSDEYEKSGMVRIEDITQNVRSEQLYFHKEKMKSIGGLATGVAHEINNPVAGMMQAAQNIERRLGMELEDNKILAEKYGLDFEILQKYLKDRQIYKFINDIRKSGLKAGKVILNMLKFNRDLEDEARYENINEIIDQSLELVLNNYSIISNFEKNKLKIKKEYTDSDEVFCVRIEIEQVFYNLFENALDFINNNEKEPSIIIRTINLEDHMRIEIEDNGRGIPEKFIEKVFEPFFSTKITGSGTGLGLAVVYFIISKIHKGEIAVKSREGKYTKFVIKLPL